VRDEIVNCLGALRETDDLIIAPQSKGARIGDILSAELRPYDVARISVEGPEILTVAKTGVDDGTIISRIRHQCSEGALSHSVGKISVRWSHSDPWLNLEWRESEGPPVTLPNHRGFGHRIDRSDCPT
jgi:hypothetical protein